MFSNVRRIARSLVVLSLLGTAALALPARTEARPPCIVCPAVVPQCPPTCLRCVIIRQTCDACAQAVCIDV